MFVLTKYDSRTKEQKSPHNQTTSSIENIVPTMLGNYSMSKNEYMSDRKRISIIVDTPEVHEKMCMDAIRDHFRSRGQISKSLPPYLMDEVILPTLGFRDRMDKVHGVNFLKLSDVLDYVTHTDNVAGLIEYIEKKNSAATEVSEDASSMV